MTDLIPPIQAIAKRLEQYGHYLEWYLFGSYAISKDSASDIDLLVIYEIISSTKDVKYELSQISHRFPVHLFLMTKDEEKELKFIISKDAVRIFPIN